MSELKLKKSLSVITERNVTVDCLLELMNNIIKKEEGDKCICSSKDNDIPLIEKELVPNIQVNVNPEGKILVADLIRKLKMCGYPLTSSNIRIYSEEAGDFVLIGSDPIDENIILDDIYFNYKLLRIQAVCNIEEKYILKSSITKTVPVEKKQKRTKERRIGYIIEKVNTWRRLYNGFYDEMGNFVKFSLDDAAKKIDISKKSLDDYLLQLRLGRKYGFDFNKNKDAKVGKLRAFVKEARTKKLD